MQQPERADNIGAGYQVEYSSMAFALFWLGEYGNILLMCAMTSVLFFGGWPAPFAALDFIPGPLWMILKIVFFFFVFAWVKASVPRYRHRNRPGGRLLELVFHSVFPDVRDLFHQRVSGNQPPAV